MATTEIYIGGVSTFKLLVISGTCTYTTLGLQSVLIDWWGGEGDYKVCWLIGGWGGGLLVSKMSLVNSLIYSQ